MTAVHIDPDVNSSPVSIFLNGKFLTYLNFYSPQEMDEPIQIRVDIPDPREMLQVGINHIMILSGADYRGIEYGVYNTDDIEFWDLYIER
jgi:hypothetical protein